VASLRGIKNKARDSCAIAI